MDAVVHLLDTWGYALLLLLGFVEFIGLPIASVPVLILAGAAAASGGLSLPLVALSAAAGGLVADLTWYWATRTRGPALVDTVCNLTSNPNACVVTVRNRIEQIGPLYIVPSKFVPGTGNLVAACAGLARLAPRPFILADTVALLLWGGVYASLGYLFTAEVTGIIEWIAGFAGIAAGVALSLILIATAWRVFRARLHAASHAPASAAGTGDPLHDMAGSAHDSPTIRPRTA